MDAGGAGRLNRSSPSCLNRSAQRIDFFHGLLERIRALAEKQGLSVSSFVRVGALTKLREDEAKRDKQEE